MTTDHDEKLGDLMRVERCPKCADEVLLGYGLAGGGLGAYVVCLNDACDYFAKVMDEPGHHTEVKRAVDKASG